MARRTPTADQKQAAEERRARMRELAGIVSKMTEAERQEIANRAGGVVTIEGRRLSLFNTVFILQQVGSASVVGGFQQWRNAGRVVRKGEKAIAMWVPIEKTTAPSAAPGGEEDEEDRKKRFRLVSVFDIAQTDSIAVAEAVEIAEAA